MQPREGELHLRFHSDSADDAAALGALGDVLKQRCLSYPRLAAQYQYRALPRLRSRKQPIKPRALGAATGDPARQLPVRPRPVEVIHRDSFVLARPRALDWVLSMASVSLERPHVALGSRPIKALPAGEVEVQLAALPSQACWATLRP
jgi:hypothetical protein